MTDQVVFFPNGCEDQKGEPSFREATRGAVMILGLLMSTTLVGALWYLYGVAQTTLYRAKHQEVADHVAFSSAVLHARGMNAIATTNLAMTGLDLSYLTLRSIRDFFGGDLRGYPPDPEWYGYKDRVTQCAKGVVTVGAGGKAACLHAGNALRAWELANGELTHRTLQTTGNQTYVFENRKGFLQSNMRAVARAVPWMGTAAASALTEEYDASIDQRMVGMTLGQSNFPRTTEISNASEGWGLPVTFADPQVACDYLLGSDGANSRIEQWLDTNLPKIKTKLTEIGPKIKTVKLEAPEVYTESRRVARLLLQEYCAKKTRAQGAKIVDGARNGSDHFQVYSWVLSEPPPDKVKANERVGFVTKIFGGAEKDAISPTTPGSPTYFAQGEFFFDCQGGWSQPDCNGSDPNLPGALLHVGWKARLRHFRPPSPEVRGRIEQFVLSGDTGGILGSLAPGAESTDAFERGASSLANQLQRALSSAQSGTLSIPGALFPPPASILPGAYGNGVYH